MTERCCPACGTDYVRRVRIRGLADLVLLLLFFQPFRCQLCTHRFRRFGRRSPADRREYARAATRFPAVFSGGQRQGTGVITDISMGGCTLETETKFFMGCLLRLTLQVSPRQPALSIEAAVVCSIRPKSVGLRFVHVRGDERERLRHLLRRLFENGSPA